MKYNTISTSSLASEGKKSSFTIYADMDISQNKVHFISRIFVDFFFLKLETTLDTRFSSTLFSRNA